MSEHVPTVTMENCFCLGKKSTAATNFGLHLHIFMGSGYRVANLSSLSLSLCAVHGYCFEWANVSGQTTSRASFVPLSAGYDFCAEGVICGENSECKNLNTKAECECRSGYASIHGDSTYCEGRTTECTVPGAVLVTACQLLLCFWHHEMQAVIKAVLCNKLADNKRTAWTPVSVLGIIRLWSWLLNISSIGDQNETKPVL